MKLGISTWAYLDFPLPRALERISELSDRAEIICEAGHSLLLPENLEWLDSFSLKYTVHGLISDINIASIHPEVRAASLKLHLRAVRASAAAGAELYVIHPGFSSWSQCRPKALESLGRSLEELALLQEELGVRLAVENMPQSSWLFFNEPDLDLHGLGLVLDVGHANTCQNVADFLSHPCLEHVHLHDNCRNADEHLALGKGSIDLVSVLKEIEKRKISAVLEQKTERDIQESLKTLKKMEVQLPEGNLRE